MHPNYRNIFLSISEYEIIIWEINESNQICREKIIVKGFKKKIIKAIFCKNDDKKFISYSKDNKIKIWNMESSFYFGSISVTKQITNIEFYKEHLFYQEENKNIVIYDPVKLFKILKININVENFFVIYEKPNNLQIKKNYDFIVYYQKSLFINSDNNTKLTFKDEPKNIFYDDNLEIIYIFFNSYLNIIKSKTMKIILNIENKYQHIFYINNQINKNFICGNFLYPTCPIKIYSFSSKEIYDPIKIKALANPKPDFWNNCIPIISNIQSLSLDNNIKSANNDYISKKYLNDEAIKSKILSNFNENLKQKMLDVSNEIKNYSINENDLESICIKFINMLIKDNTNKDLIKKYLEYLNYLENNKLKLQYKYINNFETEYNYYKVMFDDKELIQKNFTPKGFSEKDSFFNLLDSIININTNEQILNNEVFKNIENILNKIPIFNQPIKFDNKELYWFRNSFIINSSLQKIKDAKSEEKRNETFKLMQKSINNILKRKLFQKDYILNNKILITSLISLISIPQKDEYCEFNLNLIESKDPENQKNNNTNKFQITFFNEKVKPYEKTLNFDICPENYVLKSNKNMDLKDFELINYDEMEKYFKKIINIEHVNKFLSKIFCSKVIKEAFEILFPKYFSFPFKNEKEALDFINDNFHYIPYKSLKTGGLTEKMSLEVYYFLQARKTFFDKTNLNDEYIHLVEKIFYNSNAVKTNTHQMNHNFYNLLFMQSNGMNAVETLRKNNIEISESGKNLERLLFDRCLYRMTLFECIYILNEKNYDKSLEKFREDFNDIKENDLLIENNGIFSEFNSIVTFMDNNLLTNSIMVSDDNYDHDENKLKTYFIDNIEDENDVLGFIRI